jgi:hypothetical protein
VRIEPAAAAGRPAAAPGPGADPAAPARSGRPCCCRHQQSALAGLCLAPAVRAARGCCTPPFRMGIRMLGLSLVAQVVPPLAAALDNGLALTPPRAWRSCACTMACLLVFLNVHSWLRARRHRRTKHAAFPNTRRVRALAGNAFHENFNQSTIHDTIDALVAKRPAAREGGARISLQGLGYNMIGTTVSAS